MNWTDFKQELEDAISREKLYFNRIAVISIQAGMSLMWRDTSASEHEVQLLLQRPLLGR